MKIAVAATTKNKDSNVSDMAGRAPYYLIFDEKSNLIETINNPFCFGSGGAGYSVAKMLADKKINIVVAGKFGYNMTEALNERELKYYEKSGNIIDALKEILEKSS
ncbi:hypothetical protein JW911_01960 [Candidatus Peregrinibacteria bacterium]|nr:hypothetical protein [Candidatus Peregrinibacteria bacterium]